MAPKKATEKKSKIATKLCKLQKKDFIKTNPDEYKSLVNQGQYFCRKCGRVANLKKNLCKGESL